MISRLNNPYRAVTTDFRHRNFPLVAGFPEIEQDIVPIMPVPIFRLSTSWFSDMGS
jgi:hypothetical protein